MVETVFAIGYATCSATAILAHVAQRSSNSTAAGNFWLRVAAIAGLFSFFRYLSLHAYVEREVRNVSHVETFFSNLHPGKFIVLLASIVLILVLAGLFFMNKKLPKSVFIAAISLSVLVMLALIHSASLYLTGAVLQAKIGPATISRVIEVTALFLLATSAIVFARMSRSTVPI